MAKIKPEILYGDLKDKYVTKVVLYGHTDTYLYYDEKHTAGNTVNHDELLDLCMKGLVLVVTTDGFFNPFKFKDDKTTVTVSVATAVDAASSAASEYKSKERDEEEE